MPSRRDFLKKSGILAASARLAWTQPAPSRRPNVIVMLASGLPDLALDLTLHAPHLKHFAEESVQFERSYVSCPETGQSQASLFTGRFPFACGVLRDAMIGDWCVSGPRKDSETNLAIDYLKQNQHNPFFMLVAWHRADSTIVDENAGRSMRRTGDRVDPSGLRIRAGLKRRARAELQTFAQSRD